MNSRSTDPLRVALDGLMTGTMPAMEFEFAIEAALRAGSLEPAAAVELVGDAVDAGLLPTTSLSRLGLPDRAPLTRIRATGDFLTPAPNSEFAETRKDRAIALSRLRSRTESTSTGHPDTSSAIGATTTLAHFHRSPGDQVGVGSSLSGRYRLDRELGAGGMGVVYFAEDQDVKGEHFAIKVFKPEIREIKDSLEIMREEVRKTRSLAHPNIVGVYSLNVDGSTAYILMEYLEGKTLDVILDDDFNRGMPFSRAYPLINDICTGLAHAHDRGVIHCDIKPSNIFVVNSGRAKLLDFGIARVVRARAGRYDTAELGALTPGYASCEMLEGRTPDARDDVYSLGAVIYQMLSGKLPFDCPSALEARDLKLPVAPIPSLNRNQNAALAKSLAFDRAQRTVSVEALLIGLTPATSRGPLFVASAVAGLLAVIALIIGSIFYTLKHQNTATSQAANNVAPAPEASKLNSAKPVDLARAAATAAPVPAPSVMPSVPDVSRAANPCHEPLSPSALERALNSGIDASARAALYSLGSAEEREARDQSRSAVQCLNALRAAGITSADSRRFLDEAKTAP